MRKFILVFLLTFMFSGSLSNIILNTHLKQHAKESMILKNMMKRFSLKQLKNMVLIVRIFNLIKRQDDERRIQENEEKKLRDELKRQQIAHTYLGPIAGPTSVLKDIFSNRL